MNGGKELRSDPTDILFASVIVRGWIGSSRFQTTSIRANSKQFSILNPGLIGSKKIAPARRDMLRGSIFIRRICFMAELESLQPDAYWQSGMRIAARL